MKINNDHIGVVFSCVCGVHCLALPFLALTNHLWIGNPVVHEIMLGFIILLSGYTVIHALRTHCRHIVLWFTGLGIVLLGADVAMYASEGDHSFEFLALFGSACLIASHTLNIVYTKRAAKPCCQQPDH